MAYAITNPPRKLLQSGIDNSQAGNIWMYTSADVVGTVAGAGYITNAYDLGMAVNDLVFVIDTTTPLISTCRVKAVTAASGVLGLANLSAGTTVGATA